jgi:putative tryptophan/tyrosine transport system substrate-binding protein
MRRRDFIALLGGTAVAWPLAARAQQHERVRRIGVLSGFADRDPDMERRLAAFRQRLQQLGWTDDRNIRFNYHRWNADDVDRARAAAEELVGQQPDVILAHTSISVAALRRETRTIPIVFTVVSEPVAQGFVQSLARPGGNITGFTFLEPTVGAKWLELLKETAPPVTRVAVMFNPEVTPSAVLFSRSAETGARQFAVQVVAAPVREPSEIEGVMTMLGREPGGGLILPGDTFTSLHRKSIVELAARHRLPAIYAFRYFTADGGLVSYGLDPLDQYRQAAGYVDRILRGEKPADLPVQQPTKYELVINLKTAKALGLTVPNTLLATADEVIE